MSVDYKELKNFVNKLNKACGNNIKTIGIKKDVLISDFKEAVETSSAKEIPEEIMAFYKKCFGEAPIATVAEETVVEETAIESEVAEATVHGNTLVVITDTAVSIPVDIEGLGLEDAEKKLLEKLDSLDQDEWDKLPDNAKEWDTLMTDKIKAAKAAVASGKGKKPTKLKAEKAPKEPKAPKEKKAPAAPVGPRPDFKFTEGTNAAHIMTIFADMFKKSKSAGVFLKDLKAACVEAKVKSNNVNGRVTTVVKYAMADEGGNQIFKKDNLLFPKGHGK